MSSIPGVHAGSGEPTEPALSGPLCPRSRPIEMIPQSAIAYMLFIVIAPPIRFAKAHTLPFSVRLREEGGPVKAVRDHISRDWPGERTPSGSGREFFRGVEED